MKASWPTQNCHGFKMMNDSDSAVAIVQEQVQRAAREREALCVTGGGTKRFLGRKPRGTPCSVRGIEGIVHYEPTELVVSVRAGTPLKDLQDALSASGQMLPFEPPAFGEEATIGGTIASGLSGPSRPYRGAARDFVLGVRCLNGKGEVLRFGGEVMKNVAGYDIARLITGSMGTLGILTEVSLKVLPSPAYSETRTYEMRLDDAFGLMTSLLSRPLPVSASAFDDGLLRVRLSGSEAAVKAAGDELGGELDGSADTFWTGLKEQQLDFFLEDLPLWRVNVKPQYLPIDLPGRRIIDWGGALYWLKADIRLAELTEMVRPFGGWVTGFRSTDQDRDFSSPEASILQLNRRLKKAFDPAGILNPGRLFSHD